jgi:hypothetical protein
MRQTKTRRDDSSERRHASTMTEESADVDLGITPRTELGRLLLAARRAYFEAEGRFLTREELERELAELRGDDPADAGD